jgi:hypothetical protein
MVKGKVKRVITGMMVGLSLFGASVHTASADPYIPKSPQQIREEMEQRENNQGASNQEENKIEDSILYKGEKEDPVTKYHNGDIKNQEITKGKKQIEEGRNSLFLWVRYIFAVFSIYALVEWILAFKRNDGESQSSATLKIVLGFMGLSIEPICRFIGLI